ncbi:MAG: hypothetical protein IH597_08755 [Bacteroidales bacterium]|nr:hypothetical protein [Bacteroidales bacterium]
MPTTTVNGTPKTVRTPADVVEEMTAPGFNLDQEYTFKMRSFRYRNQWAFVTVIHKEETMEILIGEMAAYPLPAMLQAKQLGGNVYGKFKGYHNHGGVDYPRFWNVSVG